MPSFITLNFLLAIIVIGTAAGVLLLLATVAGRLARQLFTARAEHDKARVRPLVLAVIAGDGATADLTALRGRHRRAVDRVILGYLELVRGEAHDTLAVVLTERGSVQRLIRRSHSRWRVRRAHAAEKLGLVATGPAEDRLADLVRGDHNLEVAIVATRGLGKVGTARAATVLLESLDRADPVPAGIIAAALLDLGPEAVPALRQALPGNGQSGTPRRVMAADVLGFLDDLPAWRDLVGNLASADPPVRISAARALGRLGVPQAVGPLTRCLAPGEGGTVRAVAARSLGRIGDPSATSALASCVDDPAYWVAHNSAQALAQLGSAGRAALALTVARDSAGARHAREALSRVALAEEASPSAPDAASRGGP